MLLMFDDDRRALPAPTRFVSASATNGYTVGTDSGSGTSQSAPWLTIDHALANAVDGDVIYINDGTYTASTFYTVGKTLTLVSHRRRAVALKAATGQPRLFNYTSSTDKTFKCYGIVMDGYANTSILMRVGSSALTSTLSFEFNDCVMKDYTSQYITTNSHKKMNMSLVNCEVTGTISATIGFTVPAHESGVVTINGLTANVTMSSASTKEFIKVVSATGGTISRISRVRGTVAASSGSGGMSGIILVNHDGATISECDLTISSVQPS